MMTNFYHWGSANSGLLTGWYEMFGFWFWPLLIWSIIWKGIALWRAARRDDRVWFAVLLIINTLGILEILYIYFFSGRKRKM